MTKEALDTRLAELSERTAARMRDLVTRSAPPFGPLGAMQAYHLGWFGEDLRPLERPADSGKRLRPALCLLLCEALCGSTLPAEGVAASIELIHNFSLVHDDIQDRSPTRRGRPTVWALWGEAQAINVGDAIYAASYLATTEWPALDVSSRLEAVQLLTRACVRLVEGQYLDLALQDRPMASFDEYEAMIGGKTAALIAASTEAGALCADSDAREACREFGRTLGLAFQYQDDVLGVWGDERVTGKSADADIASGKKALPAVLAFRRADPATAETLRQLYALSSRESAEIREVRRIFDELGVREEANALLRARYQEALGWLAQVPGEPTTMALLRTLVEGLVVRSA